MQPETSRALQELADRVARRMVADALGRLAGPLPGDIVVTVHTSPPSLPPAPEDAQPRRGRKPGRKPGPKPRARRAAARPSPAEPTPKAPAAKRAYGSSDLSARACRQCHRKGTAIRVTGTERSVKCTACGCTWDLRIKASEREAPAAAVSPRPRRPNAAPAGDDVCRRCDHAADQHELNTGRCLVPRCSCAEFGNSVVHKPTVSI